MQTQKLQLSIHYFKSKLGVASYDDKEITLADIPGLIEEHMRVLVLVRNF